MADLRNFAWDRFETGSSPEDQVSDGFRFYDLYRSELASRNQIDNSFQAVREAQCAVYLCREVIQPIRNNFGAYTPNSVFRCQALERALKGKPSNWTSTSQHTKGQACDVEVPGVTNLRLAQWMQSSLAFDQLILECHDAKEGPNSGWVHVSVLPPGYGVNRGEVLSYVRDPASGKFSYVKELRTSP